VRNDQGTELDVAIPGRRCASVSRQVWRIGLVAWVSVIVVVSAGWWAGVVADRAEEFARVENETETRPLNVAASEIYRVEVSFGSVVFGPTPVPDHVLVRLDREATATNAAIISRGRTSGTNDESHLVDTSSGEWRRARTEMSMALEATDDTSRLTHAREALDAMDAAAAGFDTAAAISHGESVRSFDRATKVRNRSEWAALVAAVLGLTLGGTLMIWFARDLTGTLDALRVGASRIAAGDERYVVPVKGPAEIAEVASSFNSMAEALREREAKLAYLAYNDPLTDLGNRTTLQRSLDVAVGRLHRHQDESVALISLDLDRFKELNDSLGHSAGDEALVVVADRIRACLRATESVYRRSGDEFAVIARQTTAGAAELADRIAQAIGRPLQVADHAVRLTASVGIAFAVTGAEKTEDLLRDADLAMYAAKKGGGNTVRVFDAELLDDSTHRHRVANELADAIDADQLEVHYQPVIDLNIRTVVGAEALVRWRHPERGLLAPAEFIDIAEHSGLIVALGAQVLDIALRDSARWRRQFTGLDAFRISVNVSAQQLALADFVSDIETALARAGVSPQHLCLELTETAVLHQTADIDNKLRRVRAHGISIALDDFGTGYSSLHLINTLDVDIIKIDRTFVTGISQRQELRTLVRSVIQIATAYGRGVVVEGIESELDAVTLQELGAPMAQGYWFGRPVTAHDFEQRWLQHLATDHNRDQHAPALPE